MSEEKQQEPQAQPQEPAPVPYERFKEVNDKFKTLEGKLAEYEAKQKEQEAAQLKEQENWKALFEKTQGELKTERVNNLRLRVASSKGLPAELVDRLRGETEDELTKDAESLLAFVKNTTQDKGVPPPPKGGSNSAFDFSTATPQAIREHLAKQTQ
jgi:hypothetical protein